VHNIKITVEQLKFYIPIVYFYGMYSRDIKFQLFYCDLMLCSRGGSMISEWGVLATWDTYM